MCKINALFSSYYAVSSLRYVGSYLIMCSFHGVILYINCFVLLPFRYTLRRFGLALFSFHNVLLSFGYELFLFGVGSFHSVIGPLNMLFLFDYALI